MLTEHIYFYAQSSAKLFSLARVLFVREKSLPTILAFTLFMFEARLFIPQSRVSSSVRSFPDATFEARLPAKTVLHTSQTLAIYAALRSFLLGVHK